MPGLVSAVYRLAYKPPLLPYTYIAYNHEHTQLMHVLSPVSIPVWISDVQYSNVQISNVEYSNSADFEYAVFESADFACAVFECTEFAPSTYRKAMHGLSALCNR